MCRISTPANRVRAIRLTAIKSCGAVKVKEMTGASRNHIQGSSSGSRAIIRAPCVTRDTATIPRTRPVRYHRACWTPTVSVNFFFPSWAGIRNRNVRCPERDCDCAARSTVGQPDAEAVETGAHGLQGPARVGLAGLAKQVLAPQDDGPVQGVENVEAEQQAKILPGELPLQAQVEEMDVGLAPGPGVGDHRHVEAPRVGDRRALDV